MNFVFLMDPLHTVIFEKDTTFILMVGAKRRGHNIFFLSEDGITVKNGRVQLTVQEVTPQLVPDQPFIIQESRMLHQEEIDAVFIRTDPPFDYKYLVNTWLLDRLPVHIPIINATRGIRTANEKIWATQFMSIVPPTMISRNRNDLLTFLQDHKDIVAKPTDGHGGKSVFHIVEGERNANVILESLTDHFKTDIIVQKYIKESENGDKRILLLNGEPLGAVLRMHAHDDHRNNFFAGGKPLPSTITARDQEIIATIRPELEKLGLYFVGIDILGDYLIEVNVTSPTGLQEINRLQNVHLEDTVIQFAEKLVEQQKSEVRIDIR